VRVVYFSFIYASDGSIRRNRIIKISYQLLRLSMFDMLEMSRSNELKIICL